MINWTWNPIWFPSQITENILQRALIYAILFYITHNLAANWGGPQYFSMWYPTAGVRFAALWLWGPVWLFPMLFIEVAVQYFSGFMVTNQGPIEQLVSIVRAPICYGLAVRFIQSSRKSDAPDAMNLTAAALFAPALASAAAGLWGMARPDLPPFSSGEPLLLISTAFMIGDLLGVILIAPFLIWTYHKLTGTGGRDARPPMRPTDILEALAVFCAGSFFGILFLSVDPSISLMPVTLSISWIGLRFGRVAAWLALATSAAVILAWSMNAVVLTDQFEFHIAIAMASIAGFLASSFADEQWQMQKELKRKDRLLFQVERLKTVKAMSLAVIHDASQPLTTLALEAQHLVDVSKSKAPAPDEITQSAELIQRKVDNLSELIQRMRRFGGRENEDRDIFSISSVVKDALSLIDHETRKTGAKIIARGLDDELMVRGYSVELTQALFNLMHNAISSAPYTGFTIEVLSTADLVEIHLYNRVDGRSPRNHGFGIGFHIARSIIEAHEGFVSLDTLADTFHTKIQLPEVTSHG